MVLHWSPCAMPWCGCRKRLWPSQRQSKGQGTRSYSRRNSTSRSRITRAPGLLSLVRVHDSSHCFAGNYISIHSFNLSNTGTWLGHVSHSHREAGRTAPIHIRPRSAPDILGGPPHSRSTFLDDISRRPCKKHMSDSHIFKVT